MLIAMLLMWCEAYFCSAGFRSSRSTWATPSASATTCSTWAPSVESIRSSSRYWPGSATSTVSSTRSSTPSSTTTSEESSSKRCYADGAVPRDFWVMRHASSFRNVHWGDTRGFIFIVGIMEVEFGKGRLNHSQFEALGYLTHILKNMTYKSADLGAFWELSIS